jgi:hypothetical protein
VENLDQNLHSVPAGVLVNCAKYTVSKTDTPVAAAVVLPVVPACGFCCAELAIGDRDLARGRETLQRMEN